MIEDPSGSIDYSECGPGPPIVLGHGSCSTGAAWRPVTGTWSAQFRCVTTSLLDWAGAYGFALPAASLAAVQIPSPVVWGGASHPVVQRANALLSESMGNAALATIDTAAHFMIATHPNEVGRLITQHVHCAEAALNSDPMSSGSHELKPRASF